MQEVIINIPEEAYAVAVKRARTEGFGSAEVYLSDFIAGAITSDHENFDHIFTPELIERLDAAVAEARDGKNWTLDQMQKHFETKRQIWLDNHPA